MMRTMRNAVLAIFLTCLGAVISDSSSVAAPPPDSAPSFSCTAPLLSATERRICGNAELAGYDRELSGLYEDKMRSTFSSEKQPLVQNQQAWLRKRNDCGDSLDCIKGAYLTRIYELHSRSVPTVGVDQADQINAAIPLTSSAQNALSEMRRLVADKAVRTGMNAQFALKMKLRALTCIQSLDIDTALSSRQLHDRYSGAPCFAKQDDDIGNWLGIRTVGYLLTLPALRPVPKTALQNITDSVAPIRRVFFAAQAGVAVIESQKDAEVLDLALGTPISSQFSSPGPLVGISPNGRIFVVQDNGRLGRLRFYNSEDGALLADPLWNQYANGCGFPWLDQQTALTRDPDSHLADFYDFSSGALVPTDGGLPWIFCVTPIPGPNSTLVGFGDSGISKFKMVRGIDGKPHAEVMQTKQLKLQLRTSADTGLLAGGRQYVNVSNGQLLVTDLSDLHTDSISFGSLFNVGLAVPTSDPDEIILGGSMRHKPGARGPSEQWQLYKYAIKEQTLSLLNTGRNLLGVQEGMEFVYDSPQNMLYVMKNSGRDTTLTRVDILAGDAPVSLAAFIADMSSPEPPRQSGVNVSPQQSGVNVPPRPDLNALPPGTVAVTLHDGRIDKIYSGGSSPQSAPSGTVAITTSGGEIRQIYTTPSRQPVPDNFSQLAQNADVEGIGIIESGMRDTGVPATATRATPGAPNVKIVHVIVRARRNPIILVLSSRASVEWQIEIKSGAHLAAVLISGSNGSSIQGQGNVPFALIGSAYSYAAGAPGYEALQNEVYSWTGKRMMHVQYGDPASQFNVY